MNQSHNLTIPTIDQVPSRLPTLLLNTSLTTQRSNITTPPTPFPENNNTAHSPNANDTQYEQAPVSNTVNPDMTSPTNLPSPSQSPTRHFTLFPPQEEDKNESNERTSSNTLVIQHSNQIQSSRSFVDFIKNFESIPELGKSYIMMNLLRRCPFPTLQCVANTILPVMKRDIMSVVPLEVGYQILNYLDVPSIAKCARVSKYWNILVMSENADSAVWKQNLVRRNWLHRSSNDIKSLSSFMKRFENTLKIEKNWQNGNYKSISFPAHGYNVVTCLQLDSDKIVSGSDDSSIQIFDINTGTLRSRLEGHEGGVWALQYHGDYTLVSGSTDKSVRVWDMDQGNCTHSFDGHTSTVRCLLIVEPQFVPEKKCYEPQVPLIITGSRDSTLRVWRLPDPRQDAPYHSLPSTPSSGPNPFYQHTLEGHTSSVRAIAASHNILVSGSYDCTVRVWNLKTGECMWELKGHREKVYSVGYCHQNKRAASGSLDASVKIWSTETGQLLHNLEGKFHENLLMYRTHCTGGFIRIISQVFSFCSC